MQVWTKNIKSTNMNQNILKRIKNIELINWILIISFLLIFYFLIFVLKSTSNQIIASIILIVLIVSIIILKDLKLKLQIKNGFKKVYGKSKGFQSIMFIYIGVGLLWIIFDLLSYDDTNEIIISLNLGLCCMLIGFYNRHSYYITITNKRIYKYDYDSLKIKNIDYIIFSSDRIILKTAKKTMEIFYAELKNEEKESIINDFEELKLKNNLS